MNQIILLDTGPLVALLSKDDTYLQWSKAQFGKLTPPLYICESVISEAGFLVQKVPQGMSSILAMLYQGWLKIPFELSKEAGAIQTLVEKYANVPMSLADACIVRMSEIYSEAKVFTLDSDFLIYRKNRNETIPCIIPSER